MKPIEVEPISPPNDLLVSITAEEAANWVTATGYLMVTHRDGQMFRVIEPWERGDAAEEAS